MVSLLIIVYQVLRVPAILPLSNFAAQIKFAKPNDGANNRAIGMHRPCTRFYASSKPSHFLCFCFEYSK